MYKYKYTLRMCTHIHTTIRMYMNMKKEVRIAIKSKETSSYAA